MSKKEYRAINGIFRLLFKADAFQIRVTKALLSSRLLSERQRSDLAKQLARIETGHERIEMLLDEIDDALE